MTLTVELEESDHPEVALCFDLEGLNTLIANLQKLKSKIGHVHLMTPAWSGSDLTEKLMGGEQYRLVNSLRLVRVK